MIRINLLPPELQGKASRSARRPGGATSPNLFKGFVLLLVLLFIAAWGYAGYSRVYEPIRAAKEKEEAQKIRVNALKKTLERDREAYSERLAKWTLMQNQIEIIAQLMPDNRILWAEKINMLSSMIPEGIYITKIQLEEEVEMVETDESKRVQDEWQQKKRSIERIPNEREKSRKLENLPDEPDKVEKPVITQILHIKAATLLQEEGADRIDKVIEFRRRMQEYETVNLNGEVRTFRHGFTRTGGSESINIDIELGPMEIEVIDALPVWTFELILTTEKMKPDERPMDQLTMQSKLRPAPAGQEETKP
ncbi:hypothetical protein HQ520_05945 [bacterium]|nr:hypothetical protein [bacterium]